MKANNVKKTQQPKCQRCRIRWIALFALFNLFLNSIYLLRNRLDLLGNVNESVGEVIHTKRLHVRLLGSVKIRL